MDKSVNYLLVGGGLASVCAAEAIRSHDADGSILIVGAEPYLPYDRPPFSKHFLTDDDMKPEDAGSRPDNFYPENNVEVLTGNRVTRIDRQQKSVSLENGDTITYGKLLLATGSRSRIFDAPGSVLPGIHYLRSATDALSLRETLQNAKRVVFVGGGFIGMEAAAFASQRGVESIVIERSGAPWSQIHSSEALTGFIKGYYESKGVRLLFNDEVSAFEGNEKLEAIQTKNGIRIEADAALVAVGAVLNTELATDAGLEVDPKGVVVSDTLQTSDPSIWAAGDIACFNNPTNGRRWHVEHYMNAMWQGEAVGATMSGDATPFDQVPYFFSDIFDLSMILRGEPGEDRKTRVFGNMSEAEFVEVYAEPDGTVKMGLAFSRNYDKLEPIAEKLEGLIRSGASLDSIPDSQFE
jgi:3-phenylpropionate/trans-cinnamate dioxygenase ferredoxin reductase subunit